MKTNNNLNEFQFDKDVEQFLDAYTIEFPSESEIDDSIALIKAYTPAPRKTLLSIYKRLKPLLKRSALEIAHINGWFWVLNLSLFLVGLGSVWLAGQNPYLLVLILAPIPFIFGIIEAFKSKDENVLEMEMACKYSGQELIVARLFVIGMYNLLLNTVVTVILFQIVPDLLLTKMLLHWLTPFTFVMAISLLLVKKFRGSWTTSVLISIWSVVCLSVIQLSTLYSTLALIHPVIYIGIIVVSLAVALYEIRQIGFKYELNEEIGG
jgi:hypothetical protein